MTGIIISPQADTAAHLLSKINELGAIRIIRSFSEYPSESELTRFVQLNGPAVAFLSTEDPGIAVKLATAIDRSGTGTQVVAIDRSCDPQMLVEIMRVGVREFVTIPLDLLKLDEAIGRVTEVLARKPLAFASTDAVFSFLPAKPGDGTSTIAVNVSSAIAQRSGHRTLIADFDLNVGMVSFLL